MKQTTNRRPAWDKVLTTGLAVLLVLNILLLAVSGIVKGYDFYLKRNTRKHIDEMMAREGILCGSSVYHALETCPQAYAMRADTGRQKDMARSLLTGTIVTEAKGGTTIWSGDNGSVEWSTSGELHADVSMPELIEPQDIEQANAVVAEIFKNWGWSIRPEQIVVTSRDVGYDATIRQRIGKHELLGCRLEIVLGSENQFTIDGVWCTGDAQPMIICALENYSAEQTIFRFIAENSGLGQIISVKPAYVLSDKSGGRFTAVPCWQFTTDKGDFVLNILTGEVIASGDLEPTEDDETDVTDIDSGWDDALPEEDALPDDYEAIPDDWTEDGMTAVG